MLCIFIRALHEMDSHLASGAYGGVNYWMLICLYKLITKQYYPVT